MMSDLTRRNILVGASALATYGSILPQESNSDEETKYLKADKAHYDVIVMGGGFAGVTAARELGNAGYRVMIIEAAHRLGGRTFTSEFSGGKIELGGACIHWHQPHIWAEIVRYGLEVEKAEENIAFNKTSGYLDDLCYLARDVFPRPQDPLYSDNHKKYEQLNIKDRLDILSIPKEDKRFLEGFLSTTFRGYTDKGSFLELLRCYAMAGFSAHQLMEVTSAYRLKEDTISLINSMVLDGGAQIKLATQVSRVIPGKQIVQVVTNNGVFKCSALICAIPQNKWKDVGLLSKSFNSANQEKACNVKFYIKIKQSVKPFYGQTTSQSPINHLSLDHVDENGSILVGYGAKMNEFDIHDSNVVQDAVRAFISDAVVVESTAHDWHDDPLIKGRHSIYISDSFSQYFEDIHLSKNNIFFAGADIASAWRGFIDGAVESGLTAGRLVKDHLKNAERI